MSEVIIRLAEAADAARLNDALRELSKDLNDVHRASNEDVASAGFGPAPCFSALLAELDGDVVGVAVYSSFFSTTRGAPGVFVSDLWVAEELRGSGVARSLLSAVCDFAARQWGAAFLRLNVYHHNAAAIAAYEKLGFDADHHERVMTLGIDNFDILRANT
jgi:ribosomal protein S18 acetylase RimI-like enzyme